MSVRNAEWVQARGSEAVARALVNQMIQEILTTGVLPLRGGIETGYWATGAEALSPAQDVVNDALDILAMWALDDGVVTGADPIHLLSQKCDAEGTIR